MTLVDTRLLIGGPYNGQRVDVTPDILSYGILKMPTPAMTTDPYIEGDEKRSHLITCEEYCRDTIHGRYNQFSYWRHKDTSVDDAIAYLFRDRDDKGKWR